jgi:hypothetical protein
LGNFILLAETLHLSRAITLAWGKTRGYLDAIEKLFFVIQNVVKDLNSLKMQDSSLRS